MTTTIIPPVLPFTYKGREIYFHVLYYDRTLGYNDGRKVRVGVWHKAKTHNGAQFAKNAIMCSQGMHACLRYPSTLKYTSPYVGTFICLVELRGGVIHGDDKSVALERRVLAWRKVPEGMSDEIRGFSSEHIIKWVLASRDPGDKAKITRIR